MEKRRLYNSKREPLNEFIQKGDQVPKDKYYVVVWIWIENSYGEFLMQKRSIANKDGKWGTTAGHPKNYESSKDGIINEVIEELGIDISRDKITLFSTLPDEKKFHDLYYLKKDIDIKDIIMQKEEVDEAKWMSIKKIESLIKKDEFNKAHAILFHKCLEYLEKQFEIFN